MEGLRIKTEFLNTVIGFNNSALPLGQRDDIHLLAEMAIKSQDQSLLKLFEETPTTNEVELIKEDKILEDTADESQPIEKPNTKQKHNKNKSTNSEE